MNTKCRYYVGIIAAVIFVLWGDRTAHAVQDWTFVTTPADGNISGPAGSTLGWGYTISNLDDTYWLVLSGLDADSFQHGSADASPFDFPILAPGTSASGDLYQLIWDANAPDGFVNSGTFIAYAEWWDSDPFASGSFFDFATDKGAAYSATVTAADPAPVPEPGTWLLISTGFGALVVGRKRLSQC